MDEQDIDDAIDAAIGDMILEIGQLIAHNSPVDITVDASRVCEFE